VLDLLCVVCQHGCLEKVCTLQLSNLRQRVLELRLGFVVSARFCVYDFCMNARLHHFLINILQVLICDIYRHGMSLRKNYDQGVYGITHTKQLCIRKPVKYEYINPTEEVEPLRSIRAGPCRYCGDGQQWVRRLGSIPFFCRRHRAVFRSGLPGMPW